MVMGNGVCLVEFRLRGATSVSQNDGVDDKQYNHAVATVARFGSKALSMEKPVCSLLQSVGSRGLPTAKYCVQWGSSIPQLLWPGMNHAVIQWNSSDRTDRWYGGYSEIGFV